MSRDLTEIILNSQKGIQSAQHDLFELLAPKMFGVCIQYTTNRMEAEDCLQEGFIKVFTKIDEFRFEGSFEGWVRRIMVNTTIEHYRKNKRFADKEDIETAAALSIKQANGQDNIQAEELIELIQKLPAQYKMAFTLYAIEGYSHDEISKQLGISIGTSKSNLSRARKWLQIRIPRMETTTIKKSVEL